MTTKPRALKYRTRKGEPLTTAGNAAVAAPPPEDQGSGMPVSDPVSAGPGMEAAPPARAGQVDSAGQVRAETDIDAIKREGLTGRQLRMARRVAQKQGLAVTSDYDAVRQLRLKGVDPFKRGNILELVVPEGTEGSAAQPGAARPAVAAAAAGKAALPGAAAKVQLPQTVARKQQLPSTETGPAPNPAMERAAEIGQIQKDIARRRRRNLVTLTMRLLVFVGLPTFLVGWYFAVLATPLYATFAEFTVREQQSQGGGAGGLGGLFSGTGLATQQDAISVQSYLISRDALLRLDEDHGFTEHFSGPEIDAIRRLPENATVEEAFGLYTDMVRVAYDPTEGLLKMEVIAADAETSQIFAEALISYAEERVDELTLRVREDAMEGARESYQEAEVRRTEALQAWLALQQSLSVVDPIGETSVKTQQIAELESRRLEAQRELQTRLNVRRPNEAQVAALQGEIRIIEQQISQLRSDLTEAGADGISIAAKNTELRVAEENYNFQTIMVQQALQQMESARIEANRQVSYLSLNVRPIAPDRATYPRIFENTVLAFLIFAGIYLMISLTASILREQVSS